MSSRRAAVTWTLVLTSLGTLALTVLCAWVMYVFILALLAITPPVFGPWPAGDGFWSSLLADPWFFLRPALPWWAAGCATSVAFLLWRRAGSTSFARESALRQGLVASTVTLGLGVAILVAVILLTA
jgi:hypothetical protein